VHVNIPYSSLIGHTVHTTKWNEPQIKNTTRRSHETSASWQWQNSANKDILAFYMQQISPSKPSAKLLNASCTICVMWYWVMHLFPWCVYEFLLLLQMTRTCMNLTTNVTWWRKSNFVVLLTIQQHQWLGYLLNISTYLSLKTPIFWTISKQFRLLRCIPANFTKLLWIEKEYEGQSTISRN